MRRALGYMSSASTLRGNSNRETSEVGAGLAHNTDAPDIETSSLAYATRFRGAAGRWLLETQSRALTSLLRQVESQPLRILELGGGHAQLAPLLLQRGHHVVVQGSSADSLARVAPLSLQHPGRFDTCVANLWKLPYEDRAFDMVIAVRLLGHVTRWRELLHEMARVANGFVLIEFARSRADWAPELQKLIFRLKQRFERTTRPFFTYRSNALIEELGRCGFRLTAESAQFGVPMVVHRMLRSPVLSTILESALEVVGISARHRSPAMILAQREMQDQTALRALSTTDGSETAPVARVGLAAEASLLQQ